MVFNKSLNEDPRLFTIIQGMLMRRVPFKTKTGWYKTKKGETSVRYGRMGRPPKSTSKTSDSYGWRVP